MATIIEEGSSHESSLPREIVDALRTFNHESQLRSIAPDPDLRAGRVKVVHALAIDIAELLGDKDEDRRILQQLRARDELFDKLKSALIGAVAGCSLTRSDLESHAVSARELKGKAVWTEQFLERFAPIRLPVPESIVNGDYAVPLRGRISENSNSPLHHVVLSGTKLQLFRDGVICYTLTTTFSEDRHGSIGASRPPSVGQIIQRLAELDKLANSCFQAALAHFLQLDHVRDRLASHLSLDEQQGITLISPDHLNADVLRRRSKTHTVIFIERFYDDKKIRELYQDKNYKGDNDASAGVQLHTALASSSLPGILNTANWFHHYNNRYVAKLTSKDIGYRDDEIYITDRKATIVSSPGLWDEKDSLSSYLHDIVLAVEYNVSRLAYFASTLAYYQEHEDVRGLESSNPLDALPHVINGRAILSLIAESLDLTLLVDHGFTRLFITRLREELGFETAIGLIRQRVEDSSTSVGLKSSVLAAENTSKASLSAALENNVIQQTVSKWAKIAVVIAILFSLAGWMITILEDSRVVKVRTECFQSRTSGGSIVAICEPLPSPASSSRRR